MPHFLSSRVSASAAALGAEAPLSGSGRALTSCRVSGSAFHISYFIFHISQKKGGLNEPN